MSKDDSVNVEIDLLRKELTDAIAKASVAATNASSAATSANAAADQASSAALGGVAGARTQSNKESDSENATVFKNVSQKTDSDIGIEEAWQSNVKRTYDVHQSYDMETQVRNRTHFDTMVTEQQKHLASLNHMTLQALANNQNQSNLNNTLGIDRAWNLNETDAFAVLLNKVVGEAVKTAIAEK